MMTRKEKIYVPYHVNPAVIKYHLSRLPKDQLILHGRYIRRRAISAEPGTNEREMFKRLYLFARDVYLEL